VTRLLRAARLISPLREIKDAALVIEDGRIAAVGRREEVATPGRAQQEDFGDAVLAPGYVDIHVHGGGGFDLMRGDAQAIAGTARHLAQHGVTSFLATTVTAPWAATLETIEKLAHAGAGIHLEGPFLSPQRRGVHPEPELLLPTLERLEAMLERAPGRVRIITMAPELAGGMAFLAEASRRGICVSMGHSDATLAQARAGMNAGARHVTHTFNAMRPLHQREPGLLGLALSEPGLSAEIIADGIHVAPELVGLFFRLKAPEAAVLVSDGISASGCGDGEYLLGGIHVTVAGECCRHNGILAGSVLTLDTAVRHAVKFGALGLAEAVRMATLNPAELAGLKQKGRLETGMDADVLVLSGDGDLKAVFQGGERVK
jgi:N-acetylglucosamine-6-phosphate deacetylase